MAGSSINATTTGRSVEVARPRAPDGSAVDMCCSTHAPESILGLPSSARGGTRGDSKRERQARQEEHGQTMRHIREPTWKALEFGDQEAD